MDRKTVLLRKTMLDYLDECADSRTPPVDEKTQEAIQAAVNSIGDTRENTELSPGQRQALDAAGDLLDEVQVSDEGDSLSPGERAAQSV